MNERIKELAEQSGIWFEANKEIRTHSVSTTTLERFAEMIILECADIASTAEPYKSNDLIKEHFGVDHEQKN